MMGLSYVVGRNFPTDFCRTTFILGGVISTGDGDEVCEHIDEFGR